MRLAVFIFTMLTSMSFAAAQDVEAPPADESSDTEVAEEEPLAEPSDEVEQAAALALILEPTPEEIAEEAAEEVPAREEPAERGNVPYWRRDPRRISGPVMGARNAHHRRELNRVLRENSLRLPLVMVIGGPVAALGLGAAAFASCPDAGMEVDPVSGREHECGAGTAALAVLAVASGIIATGGVFFLLSRVVMRRIAYRRYRTRTQVSLNSNGLQLRF